MMLVNSENGTLRLSKTLSLYRFTKDALGETCDGLMLHIDDAISNYPASSPMISSRDFDGIIDEVANAIEDYYSAAGKKNAKDVRNGYFG